MIRQPVVAGLFYPKEKKELLSFLEDFYKKAPKDFSFSSLPRAFIVPHAGYIYSGEIAMSAFIFLEKVQKEIQKILLLGPSHFIPFDGVALPQEEIFLTPLGEIPIDLEEKKKLLSLFPFVKEYPLAHKREHSLEVELPFLQFFLSSFQLIPLSVGKIEPSLLGELIDLYIEDPSSFVVISSDLSHYLPYEEAKKVDEETKEIIEEKRYEELSSFRACGYVPIQGILEVARRKNLQVKCIDLRNSGDTAGSREEVVGYGSFLIF